MAETWLLCSACRTPIGFGTKYFQCSVSTCNRARMRLVFCSVACWDSHVASARHRDSWAEDKIAPSKDAWARELADQPAEASRLPTPTPAPRPAAPTPPLARPAIGAPAADPARRIVGAPAPVPAPTQAGGAGVHLNDIDDRDMMIVVSKLKKYIKDRSGMNCSDAVADVLSDHVRILCDDSIRAAGRDERKTVLDRDVPRPRRP
ncbi:MAG: hypothetical protein ABIY55_07910 [Kofleriaceae bacterium]